MLAGKVPSGDLPVPTWEQLTGVSGATTVGTPPFTNVTLASSCRLYDTMLEGLAPHQDADTGSADLNGQNCLTGVVSPRGLRRKC